MKHTLFCCAMGWSLLQSLVASEPVKLHRPIPNAQISNNTPMLAWEKTEGATYELWINNRLMQTLPEGQNFTVPFPLSFGTHQWKIVARTPNGDLHSETRSFHIDDQPVNTLPQKSFLLRYDWKVKSSAEIGNDGKTISSTKTDTQGWATTSLPATVLTALVRNGIYPNPYVEQNNMRIPDCNDQYNQKYNLLQYSHIKGKNPWSSPYWYRTEFELPEQMKGQGVELNLAELNYRAEVWINGQRIADTAQVVGMERHFVIDITHQLNNNDKNILAIAIYPPDHPGEPAPDPITPLGDPGTNMGDGIISKNYTKWDVLGWDWQPAVRDRDMGITEEIYLSVRKPVTISEFYVSSNLHLPDTTRADITASAKISNQTNSTQTGTARFQWGEGSEQLILEQAITLAPYQNDTLWFDPSKFAQLKLSHAKLWWPVGYGEPNLYNATIEFVQHKNQVDHQTTRHGIRKVESLIGAPERIFKINGVPVYPKGGNWVLDMMLNWNASRYQHEIALTKNANLNILRIWGPTGVAPEALFRAADEQGIMLWQDFLNDFWGTFKNAPGYHPDADLVEKTTIEIVKKYRNHPSLVIWCGGNEGVNPLETLITQKILPQHDARDSRFYLKQSDGDGLHGGGPYHTLEPSNYFTHPKLMGFSSEIGPSGVPVLESMRKFMHYMGASTAAAPFPLDATWAYHDANNWPGNDTRKFSAYDNMLRNYFGAPNPKEVKKALENYLRKCQWINYDVYRAAIESINHQLWNNSSGILLWKSNSSWPSITWQIYDWYLQAHAGYYGTQKAAATHVVQWNRHNQTVSYLQTGNKQYESITIKATLTDTNGKLVWQAQESIHPVQNGATLTQIHVPKRKNLNFLTLEASAPETKVADNFYWLHPKNNFKSLFELPAPILKIKSQSATTLDGKRYTITVTNVGNTPALMTAFRFIGTESGTELLPAIWSDNYLNLMPGQNKTIECTIPAEAITETPCIEWQSLTHNKTNLVQL